MCTCGLALSDVDLNACSSSGLMDDSTMSFSTAVLVIHSMRPTRVVIGTTSYVLCTQSTQSINACMAIQT